MTKTDANKPIKLGDVVVLNSGSARMTVLSIVDGEADLLWSDFDSKELRDATIPLVALVHA